MSYLTVFSVYSPQRAVSIAVHEPGSMWELILRDKAGALQLGPVGCNLILLAMGVAAYAVAAWQFRRRDLPAPL